MQAGDQHRRSANHKTVEESDLAHGVDRRAFQNPGNYSELCTESNHLFEYSYTRSLLLPS